MSEGTEARRPAEAGRRRRGPVQRRDHVARRATARRRRRAARRADAARQGPDRHRRHPHDVRLADLRRPRPGAPRDRRRSARSTPAPSSSARRTCPSSRGACSARTRGTGRCTTRSIPGRRPAARRPATRPRSRPGSSTSGSAPTPGCSIRLPVGRLRHGRAQVAVGRCSRSTASSRSARRSTPSARWGGRSRTSRCSGRCSSGAPVPEPRLDGLTIGLLRRAPGPRRRARDRAERCGRAVGRRPRATRRARRRGGDPGARRRTCGPSSCTRRPRATGRPSPPARTSTAT